MALITATTAASVTGTVAWFTANRAVTVTAGDFIATKLESNLTVTTAAGNGTATSNRNTGITTTTTSGSNDYSNKLTHGSYDAQAITTKAAGNLYVAKVSDDGTKVDEFKNLGTEAAALTAGVSTSSNSWLARTVASTKTNIWYGLSWKMTFTLDGGTNNTTDYLLIDPTTSEFKASSSDGDNTTYDGFRIAFMTSSSFFVLGADEIVTHCPATITSSDTGTQTIAYANYTVGTNYQSVGTSVTKAEDESASASTKSLAVNKYNLGAIDATDGLTVTCVAWYEGSDAAVADKNSSGDITMSDITATLSFYTRGIIA